jgi:FeS assembly SUF system regulator
MLRISKMADYGTVVMAYLAERPDEAQNARDIAVHTHLALPTVSKILKLLAKGGLLLSQRGAKGGYSLARPAEKISVAEIIQVMDGKLALTECSHAAGTCSLESVCTTRSHWKVISQTIYHALAALNLSEMAKRTPLQTRVVNFTRERKYV